MPDSVAVSGADDVPDIEVKEGIKPAPPKPSTPYVRLIVPDSKFANFVPPEYEIDGLLLRACLYALTGQTGAGKTAIAQLLTAHIVLGLPLLGREIEQGKVLYLCENEIDAKMRWIKLCEEMDLDHDADMVWWREVPLPLTTKILDRLCDDCRAAGPFVFVAVDTQPAYFPGDKEDDNKQQGDYARSLRRLTEVDGRPTVLVLCHPTKNAGPEELIPRGGSAFLFEVDGNLTCVKRENIAELHWLRKFRGPDFAPISFRLTPGQTDKLKDRKGRKLWTVTACAIGATEEAARRAADKQNEDQILKLLVDEPSYSINDMASAMGWTYPSNDPNDPKPKSQKSKVHRILKTLENDGLAKKRGGHYEATTAGKTKARTIVANRPNVEVSF